MRDMLKRLDALERFSGTKCNLPVVFIQFVGPPYEPGPATISYRDGREQAETLTRLPGESMSDFEARATAHFEPRRLPRCGMVLFVDGGEPCATS